MAVVLFAESGATMSIRVEIEKKITDLQEIIDAAKTYYMRASKDDKLHYALGRIVDIQMRNIWTWTLNRSYFFQY